MSAVISEAIWARAPRRKLTVENYHRMAEAGIFGPEERVELIEGELIQMSPIGYLHANEASRLIQLFAPRIAGRAIVWTQNPVHLGNSSEPQPDFALLRHRPNGYDTGLPAAADVLLLVEIADSSLGYDRGVKIPLYARHGIPEYWIVNVAKQQIEVHLDPDPEQGRYREARTLAEGLLAPACFPDLALDVRELLR
jgi:Uma2 family endonuclease